MKPHFIHISAALIALLFGPLCTSADENIKVDTLHQKNPNLVSIPNDLVCLSLFLLCVYLLLRITMSSTKTTTVPEHQLTRRSKQSGSLNEAIVTLEQISSHPDTSRHVEARKKLNKSMQRGWGNWNAQHPRHRLLDALYGYSRYYERQKVELDRVEGLYKHVSKAQRSVS
jgi:carnosine N-methyltransferase